MTKDIPYYDRWGKVRRPDAGSVVKNRKGVFAIALSRQSLLLTWQSHAPDVPELPGGGVDEGENPGAALAREFFEETGLEISSTLNPPDHSQHIGFFADDVNEFWRYEQNFHVLRGPALDRLFFTGEKLPPEHGIVRWLPLAQCKTLQIHYCHALALSLI